MIPITDICDFLVVVCPKCKTGQFVKEWGVQKCYFEGCDKHKFDVPYNPELLLKEAVKVKKQFDDYVFIHRPKREKPGRMQKTPDGWIFVRSGVWDIVDP